jgi:hypothetical protein
VRKGDFWKSELFAKDALTEGGISYYLLWWVRRSKVGLGLDLVATKWLTGSDNGCFDTFALKAFCRGGAIPSYYLFRGIYSKDLYRPPIEPFVVVYSGGRACITSRPPPPSAAVPELAPLAVLSFLVSSRQTRRSALHTPGVPGEELVAGYRVFMK